MASYIGTYDETNIADCVYSAFSSCKGRKVGTLCSLHSDSFHILMARAQRLRILYHFKRVYNMAMPSMCIWRVVDVVMLRSRSSNGCIHRPETQKRIRNSCFESQNQHRAHAQYTFGVVHAKHIRQNVQIFVSAFAIQHGHDGGSAETVLRGGHRRRPLRCKSPRQFSPKNFCDRKAVFTCIRNFNEIFHLHQRPTGECAMCVCVQFAYSIFPKMKKTKIDNRCVFSKTEKSHENQHTGHAHT